jgi:hypothetical protein
LKENTSMSDSFEALRRANPRAKPGFAESVETATQTVRAQIATAPAVIRSRPRRRRVVGVSLAGVSAAAGAALIITIASSGEGTVAQSAYAALKEAATVTAESAERSGTARFRITHDGEPYAANTIRWGKGDIVIFNHDRPQRSGGNLLMVDNTLYATEGGDDWIDLGDPSHIDDGSGTSPSEYLAAVREDVGGDTFRRITEAMTNLSRRELDDGSIEYSGKVPAGQIARETGFKEGQHIRLFPFGYVAHDEAADPDNQLDTIVTTGADGVVREIAVRWGTWRYTVSYSHLGSTPAPEAPKNAKSLEDMRR